MAQTVFHDSFSGEYYTFKEATALSCLSIQVRIRLNQNGYYSLYYTKTMQTQQPVAPTPLPVGFLSLHRRTHPGQYLFDTAANSRSLSFG